MLFLAIMQKEVDEASKLLDECYHGEYTNEEDFLYCWIHEVNGREIPEFLQHYIDYKAMAYDFFINDFFLIEVDHKAHVFSHH
jgi:antirestriction protein